MHRLPAALASALLIGVASAAADAPAPTPPPAPVEHVEVRLAQFDVVVRDAKGAIVSGLGPGEFKVLEDGSPLEVVAVDEWGLAARPSAAPASTAPAEPPPVSARPGGAEPERRSFVIVFDALGDSTALRMNQAKSAAVRFVRAHIRPDDLAAVYQLDLSLRPMSGVTSSADDLARGIERVTWMAASSLQDDIAESILSSAMRPAVPHARDRLSNFAIDAAQQLDWQREHVYESLNNLASLFRGLPGRRVLVLVSPGFPMTTAGDAKNGAGGFTPQFAELIRSLATYGVTVYTMDIGDDLAAGDVSRTIDWRAAVGTLGMDEATLSDLGLERSLGTGSASSRREFLGVLAGETGGRMLTQSDLTKAFEAVQEESSRFYRVSCRVPVTHAANRYRKLVVSVKTAGYVVTARRGRYSDVTPNDRPSSGAKATVESVDRYRPIAARGVATPLPAGDPKNVPVEIIVEALGPIQLATDSSGGASLDLEIHIVARAAGEIVDRYDHSFTARVKPEGVPALRKAFRVDGRLNLLPGIYEIQSSVRLGEPPQLANWTSTVSVHPQPKETDPVFAGAILNNESDEEAPLLSRPPITDEVDSLTLKPGVRIVPSTHTDFEAGGGLLVLFWLRGFAEADGKPPPLDLSFDIEDQSSRKLTVPTSVLFFGKEPTGGYRGLARVDTATLGAGTYTLRLAAAPSGAAAAKARRSLSFTLRAKEGRSEVTSSSASGAP